jgi:DNA-binding transcriptional regulator GbsR (MarR family)
MKLVRNNPYRTVGILVGATAREQERQIKRLKQYIEAEQDHNHDYSFPVLGDFRRTVESVNEAAAKLNLDKDKLDAALFWFYNGNPITDEPAFDALKDSDVQTAASIWSKLIKTGDLTPKNSSAFQNLSTLLLCLSINGSSVNAIQFEEGLNLKLRFLEDESIKDFKAKVTDDTFKTTKNEIQLSFLNALHNEIDKHGGISLSQFIGYIIKQNFSAKNDFLRSYSQLPIQRIEKEIEAAKSIRKANKARSAVAGNNLYKTVINELILLSSMLGTKDLKYTSISDKVADEVLQCGIDYFLHHRDSETDPGELSMDLFKKANKLALGHIVKQRCEENTSNLQEWIDDKPEREKQKRVLADFEEIKKIIDQNEPISETVYNARQLLEKARPVLARIKSVLGSNDQNYIGASTRIAADAQGMCVTEINLLQKKMSDANDIKSKKGFLATLKTRVQEAWIVTNTIGLMDLESGFRRRFNENKINLSNLSANLDKVKFGVDSWAEENPGCLIALIIGAIFFLISILSN